MAENVNKIPCLDLDIYETKKAWIKTKEIRKDKVHSIIVVPKVKSSESYGAFLQYHTWKVISCGFVLLSVSNISKTVMEKQGMHFQLTYISTMTEVTKTLSMHCK